MDFVGFARNSSRHPSFVDGVYWAEAQTAQELTELLWHLFSIWQWQLQLLPCLGSRIDSRAFVGNEVLNSHLSQAKRLVRHGKIAGRMVEVVIGLRNWSLPRC